MEFKIKAIPQEWMEKEFNLSTKQLEKVYSGKLNNCRCGCEGNYYYENERPVAVTRAMNKLQSGKYEVKYSTWEEKAGEVICLEIITNGPNKDKDQDRGLTFYFQPNPEATIEAYKMGYVNRMQKQEQ